MTILSYIGNVICALLCMVLLIACVTNGTSMEKSGMFDGLFAGLLGVFAIMSALVIVMCWLCIIGITKMKKGIRRGFILYLIGNGLWVILLIYSGRDGGLTALLGALVSIGFIAYYAMKIPKLSK